MANSMRLWYPGTIELGQELHISAAASHYLNVRRLVPGSMLRVFNGQGAEYIARVVSNKRRESVVTIESLAPCRQVESPAALHLMQLLTSSDKMAWIIQKAVELGIASIRPCYTNANLDDERLANKQDHWQAIAVAASEQSQRLIVPPVFMPASLNDGLATLTGQVIALEPRSTLTINQLSLQPGQPITIISGPESGFTATELAMFAQYAIPLLNLGPRILRAETAPLVAITLLQHYYGDLSVHTAV